MLLGVGFVGIHFLSLASFSALETNVSTERGGYVAIIQTANLRRSALGGCPTSR
jgi:hypothetical protein